MNKLLFISFILLVSCSQKQNEKLELGVKSPKSTKWSRVEGIPLFDKNRHSDGCSGGMSLLYQKLTFLHDKHGNELKWRKCCEIHDKAYYYGGSKALKKAADKKLNQCVSKIVGNRFLGTAMEAAVKIGGGPYLPTSYRWGYGEDYKKK